MARRSDLKRIHAAQRAAQVARMTSDGWSSERAEACVGAWEEYADTERRERGRPAYYTRWYQSANENRPEGRFRA
jgi:hypothetical protein